MPIPIADMLDFEDAHRRAGGAKEEAIRDRFGIPPAVYYARLHRAIDTLDAQELRPLTVKRLRRLRDQRERQRSSRVRCALG